MHPTPRPDLPQRLRRGAARLVAALLPALGLATTAPAALAQGANPWMDPTLIVAVTRQEVTQAMLNGLPATAGATLVDRLGQRRIFLLRRGSGQTTDELVSGLKDRRFGLLSAGLNRRVDAPETVGAAFGAIKNSVNAIGEAEAADKSLPRWWTDGWLAARGLQTISRGNGVTVAVLDTGIDLLHPAFVARLTSRPGSDLVSRDDRPAEQRVGLLTSGAAWGHGTHVAGTVAAVAPGARILPVRVLDGNGTGTLWTMAKGTVLALDPDGKGASADGARVLNMSFGVRELTPGEDAVLRVVMKLATCHPEVVARVTPFDQAGYQEDRLRCADRKQRPVVVAGQGNNAAGRPLYPAAYSGILPSLIAVTASEPRGYRARWATRGAAYEVVAPGQWITSAYPTGDPRGQWAIMSGTSMATPWVSGVAALLMAMPAPTGAYDGQEIRKRILGTAARTCDSSGPELAPLRALLNRTTPLVACR